MDKMLNFVHYNVNLGRICVDREYLLKKKMLYFYLMKCMYGVTVVA